MREAAHDGVAAVSDEVGLHKTGLRLFPVSKLPRITQGLDEVGRVALGARLRPMADRVRLTMGELDQLQVMTRVAERRLTRSRAAALLGLSEHQVRRL